MKLATSIALFVIALGLSGGGMSAADPAALQLPEDKSAVVLRWDHLRVDLPLSNDVPRLTIRADGSVTVADPNGPGKEAEARLSAGGLQELLHFVVRSQRIFELDGKTVRQQIRAKKLELGLPPEPAALSQTRIRIHADGREHEVRCSDLSRFAASSRDTGNLHAIEQRLEKLAAWCYAGGDEGIEKSLGFANGRVRKEFTGAPLLTADDLQSALQQANGQSWVIFERRAVASDRNPWSFVFARVNLLGPGEPVVEVKANLADITPSPRPKGKRQTPTKIELEPAAEDPAVRYDYPIVYVRAPRLKDRRADAQHNFWPNVDPIKAPPGSELMILHPDGREEVLVPVKPNEAITDPFVSFDAQWVFFAKFHDATVRNGSPADIYKVHVPTRKVVRLTHQEASPNIERAESKGLLIQNLAPCPAPGGKVVFISNRNGFRAVASGVFDRLNGTNVPRFARQLFVMDEDGSNVEMIGHLNLGDALHPVILKDGRIMFSTRETQGLRIFNYTNSWGLWTINPDGTNWGPLLSAFRGSAFHFQSQLSDGGIVVGHYYLGQITKGFGTYFTFPVQPPDGYAGFGPANPRDPWNMTLRLPFSPYGMEELTRFADPGDVVPNKGWGGLTHPSGAPDNHLLTVWAGATDGPRDLSRPPDGFPGFDSGICLIKFGRPIDEPRQMRLIKNDPNYHEMWPRALVPYRRIYGIDEPPHLPRRNDGRASKHLPEGTPFGLVGTSSLYKRESYPEGKVPEGKVTAVYAEDRTKDPFRKLGGVFSEISQNWSTQGADSALYDNDEIHAIRIVATEPVTAASGRFHMHASRSFERLRILGEFPVRKFNGDKQPTDPDGNPDTSFLAKLPADVAWTFQTLDRNGMVLNSAQTWHQLRPGEVRNNCGGCHAHSQQPTRFELTAAAKDDYAVWDLTRNNPLLTGKKNDQTGKKWDADDQTGVRFAESAVSVEYHRDIKPILARSCVACHTKSWEKPAGELVLDDDDTTIDGMPGTYYRLAADNGQPAGQGKKVRFGPKPVGWIHDVPLLRSYTRTQASRYVRKMQSRRSLLVWKIFGERLDGFSNEDHPSASEPGSGVLMHQGKPVDPGDEKQFKQMLKLADVDYRGSIMPPPEAVAGTYRGPDGKPIKVAPLTDEDRRTLVRWIDLGCPVDLGFTPERPNEVGQGLLRDEGRPTLTLAEPRSGHNPAPLTRILVGMHDYYTGLDMTTFTVTADFEIDGVKPGENLASKFRPLADQRWELELSEPIASLPRGRITVSVKDRHGNRTLIERTFSVGSQIEK